MRQTYIFLFVLGVVGQLSAQSGCPGCIIALPADLGADTIYLDAAPNGVLQQPYQADLSFRMPITTTPVANTGVNVPPGLNITNIEIRDVRGLPPGVQWEASQTEFDLPDETDGCVRLCGTPFVSDSFTIEVVVFASLGIFGQETSLSIPLFIEPSMSMNDGFSLVNNIGCGEVTTAFVNNVPSNGNEGFSYRWDFGDQTFSEQENPAARTYTTPGVYPIGYQAIIDTTGYFLTGVSVLETDCSDAFGGRPDLKINVFDPAGELLYTAPIIENAQVPVSFSTFIELEEGNYSVQVIDDDSGLGGADDDCGTVGFTRETPGMFTAGELTIEINIFHPVDTIQTIDTVTVFALPALPIVDITPGSRICAGDSVGLEVLNFIDGLAWTFDSSALNLPDAQTVYYTAFPGEYTVTYTSPDGCQSQAIAPTFEVDELPPTVVLENFGNVVQVFNQEVPLTMIFGWELNGQAFDESQLRFCATESGTYTLVITDVQTGCSSRSSIDVTYDPALACDITSVLDPDQLGGEWTLYPNPSEGPLSLQANLPRASWVEVNLVGLTGCSYFRQSYQATQGEWQQRLPELDLPAGAYFLLVTTEQEQVTLPVVRR